MELKAIVTRITTTADQSVRLTLEIDKDMVPSDVFVLLNHMVRITDQ
jgi:hypothetical protein